MQAVPRRTWHFQGLLHQPKRAIQRPFYQPRENLFLIFEIVISQPVAYAGGCRNICHFGIGKSFMPKDHPGCFEYTFPLLLADALVAFFCTR